jgi:superoxide reductase
MFGKLLQTAKDEGKEKHVPVIHAPEKVQAGEFFSVTVNVGEEVPHPNIPEHHIKWIQVFSKSDGQNTLHIMTFDVAPVLVDPKVTFSLKLDKTATLHAIAYCNIHGVWESSFKVEVE